METKQDLVCTDCGKVFSDNRTSEEKLVDAIFAGVRCSACRREPLSDVNCEAECGRSLSPWEAIYFNDRPYHPKCLPYGGEK